MAGGKECLHRDDKYKNWKGQVKACLVDEVWPVLNQILSLFLNQLWDIKPINFS